MDTENQAAPDASEQNVEQEAVSAPQAKVEDNPQPSAQSEQKPLQSYQAQMEPVQVQRPVTARPAPKWPLLIALLVLPVVLLALYGKTLYVGLINPEALDFAQVGHNISAGRGMVTYVLRPLALTHGPNLVRQPDVTHGPLYPFVLAVAFGALGARDAVVSGVSGLFYLLTVPLLYLLGLRVFNRNVGLIAAVAFACSGLVLQYAVSGLPITLYTFLFTALFLTLYNLSAGKAGKPEAVEAPLSPKLLVLSGVLTGLLYLTDPIFFWVLPVVAIGVYSICGPKRRAAVVKFALPLGVVVLPWMARNFMVTGNPVFGLRGLEFWMNTPYRFPGHIAYRFYNEEFGRGTSLLPTVLKKILLGVTSLFQGLPQISNAWILAFLLPCLMFGYSSRSATLLRRIMMFSALALVIGMLLFQLDMPMFTCLIPAMLVFSIAYLTHLVRQAQLSVASRWTLASLLAITLLYPLASQMMLEDKLYPVPEVAPAKAMTGMAKPEEVVLSDRPEAVAWYADRPAILIPFVDKRIAEIRTQYPQARWLFLTPQARTQSAPWQLLYDQCVRWNGIYDQARTANAETPPLIRISSNEHPLFRALTGFTSVAPLQNAPLTTVIAVVPETKLSMGSEPGRQPAP